MLVDKDATVLARDGGGGRPADEGRGAVEAARAPAVEGGARPAEVTGLPEETWVSGADDEGPGKDGAVVEGGGGRGKVTATEETGGSPAPGAPGKAPAAAVVTGGVMVHNLRDRNSILRPVTLEVTAKRHDKMND